MSVKRLSLGLAGALVLLASLTLTTSAEGAVPKKALTCGMNVSESVQLYLPQDLTCPGDGVRIYADDDNPGITPNVKIDLRGHTLRGPGAAQGVSVYGVVGRATASVSNGRLKDWDIAVAAGSDTGLTKVVLKDNRVGLACSSGGCTADRAAFLGNETGADAAGEGAIGVTRSIFIDNTTGASVSFGSSLGVDRSIFIKNETAMESVATYLAAASTTFVRNDVAVRVIVEFPEDNPQICADLTKPVFVQNGQKVVGPRC